MRQFKMVIIGSGSGGISVAARLRGQIPPSSIAIIDPADTHYYQPLWTVAGAGLIQKQLTAKPQSQVIPKGVQWIQQEVKKVDPAQNCLILQNGEAITYEFLLVASGLRLAWEKITGAREQLGSNGICSIYQYDSVDYVAELLQNFKGGNAIFTMPPVPIKCAGAPQKIMYLADHIFRKNNVREKTKIQFMTAGKAMFGVPIFAKALDEVVKRKAIEPRFSHRLVSINADSKKATFAVTNETGQTSDVSYPFDLIHVVPPMVAHSFIADSELAAQEGDQKGWLAVDKHTLQHLKYKNIFGVGDVTGVPNSKTGAAIRKQAPVVTSNILACIGGRQPLAKYDGYSSCPLITEIGKVMLAEFGYDGKLMPTFPLDPTKERRSMWHLKKNILPRLYWHGMLKGRV